MAQKPHALPRPYVKTRSLGYLQPSSPYVRLIPFSVRAVLTIFHSEVAGSLMQGQAAHHARRFFASHYTGLYDGVRAPDQKLQRMPTTTYSQRAVRGWMSVPTSLFLDLCRHRAPRLQSTLASRFPLQHVHVKHFSSFLTASMTPSTHFLPILCTGVRSPVCRDVLFQFLICRFRIFRFRIALCLS